MKILFIQPPKGPNTILPMVIEPLGMAYVAAVAQQNGHQVDILDLLADPQPEEKWLAALAQDPPELVAFSVYSSNCPEALHLAGKCKERFGSKVVFGGVHPSNSLEVLENDTVDFVVVGEGETTFLELAKHLENPQSLPVEKVNGIAYRQNGQTIKTAWRERIADLDSMPLPLREKLPVDKYFVGSWRRPLPFRRRRTFSVCGSRGCPYNCYFCISHNFWRGRVSRSPRSILDEMHYLKQQYAATNIFFTDEDVINDRASALELLQGMVSEKLDMGWMAYGGFYRLDEEIADWLAKSGCEVMLLGIETLAEDATKKIGKNTQLQKVVHAVNLLHQRSISAICLFIIGFPWETENDLMHQYRLAKKIPMLSFDYHYATPYPGTRLWEDAVKENLIEVDDTAEYNMFTPVMRTRHLSTAELRVIHRRITWGTVFSFSFIGRYLKTLIRNPVYTMMIVIGTLRSISKGLMSVLR